MKKSTLTLISNLSPTPSTKRSESIAQTRREQFRLIVGLDGLQTKSLIEDSFYQAKLNKLDNIELLEEFLKSKGSQHSNPKLNPTEIIRLCILYRNLAARATTEELRSSARIWGQELQSKLQVS
jgi:hypothetical protein